MARDCPDRQRGADWRNDRPGPGGARPDAARIGGGDAVDREYEQLMQELNGGGPIGNGAGAQRIEGGPGGYDNGPGFAGEQQDLKPWQRGPTGAPAPWQQRGRDDQDGTTSARPWANGGGRGGDSYGGHQQGNYGAPPGAAPWQQAAPAAPQSYANYGYPPAGYADQNYGAATGYAPPPPGFGALFQAYGGAGSPPPPPPPGDAPPPPVSISLFRSREGYLILSQPPSDLPPPPPPPAY